MADNIKYQGTLESSRHDGDLETSLSDGKSTFGKLAFTEDVFDKDQNKSLADIIKNSGKAIKQRDDTVKEISKHVYPRIVMSENDLDELIDNGGPFEEGIDYLAYEDNS